MATGPWPCSRDTASEGSEWPTRLQVADDRYLGTTEVIDSGTELPAGTYYVGVTECYGRWARNPYRLGQVAGTLVVDVRLPARSAAGFATVHVVPQPPVGAQVPGQAGTTGEAVDAVVGERGRAIVTGLPDGQYRVTVSAPGHVTLGCGVELVGGFLSAAEGALTCQGTGDAAWHGPPNQVTCSLAFGDLNGDGLVRLRDLVVLARRLGAKGMGCRRWGGGAGRPGLARPLVAIAPLPSPTGTARVSHRKYPVIPLYSSTFSLYIWFTARSWCRKG